MDLNLKHFRFLANAPLENSFEGYSCTVPNNGRDNSGDTLLRLDSQGSDQSKPDHSFHPMNRSGSFTNNSAFPREMLKKWSTVEEARSKPLGLDDECVLVLGLGCTPSTSHGRNISLPEMTSSATFLKDNDKELSMDLGSDLLANTSFQTASEVSFDAMQTYGTSSKKGLGSTDGATSQISYQECHNVIQGHQNVNSNTGLTTFFQPANLENKVQEIPNKSHGAMVTKSVDMDPGILQLGLSRVSSQSGKSSVINQSSFYSQPDCLLVLGQRQEISANGTESPRIMHIPVVDEGSTSARWKSGGYMPSLLMAPRLENSDLDARPQMVSTSLGITYPLQGSPELSPGIRSSSHTMNASGASGHAEQRSSSKTCKFKGCAKGARGASGLCIAHGGGHRCQKAGCSKGAESRTVYCKAHGGGRRCQRLGCTKSAEGRTDYCIGHGGGRRCSHEGCGKAARGKSGLCIRHGGGKRCQKEGCTKSAEGYSGLCISHGGGRRCQHPDCSKGAQGSTMYCKAHGGGKRCMFTGCNKGAEGSTPLCKGHGGGKRCMFDGGGICPKSVHGGTQFCVAHGGGKRCAVQGCTKSARGRTDYCVKHGGGKRCKSEGCGKSAQGSTDFCKAHGGGKRCLWGQEGSVYAGEILHGKNGEILHRPCDRFARGKTGLCAAHSALVQEQRFHGGNTLGPGIGPSLFCGLVSASVPNADSDSSQASALSSDNLPQIGNAVELESFGRRSSESLNVIKPYSAVMCNAEQNMAKDVNDVDMGSTEEKKDGEEVKLTPHGRSEMQPKINHLVKWNLYPFNGGQVMATLSSVNDGNVDVNKGYHGYWSAFVHPNNHPVINDNVTPGGVVVGRPVGKQGAFAGLPINQGTNHSQVPGPLVRQVLIPPQVLVPLPMKKRGLTTSQVEKQDGGSGCSGGRSLSLPEGRVHGGSLMTMLSRDSRSGDVGFMSFSVGTSDPAKTSQGAEKLRTFQHGTWM
eukprot:Gb_27707 [translate_table: standard]